MILTNPAVLLLVLLVGTLLTWPYMHRPTYRPPMYLCVASPAYPCPPMVVPARPVPPGNLYHRPPR